jgi:ABC-type transport system involved in multi-copper enzyme maturation permease subunit
VSVIARYSIGEALRRRVFLVIVVLTAAFLALYALGSKAIFDEVEQNQFGTDLIEETTTAGGTLLGLGMFVTMFLGVVLAVFMTMSTVRGDAERGVLQPLAVRPIGRVSVLLGRLAAALAVTAAYVAAVFALLVLITWATGDWTPDHVIAPAAGVIGAVAIVTCLSVLGSIFLSTNANGIAIFMIFGAGLTAGLLSQIGEALDSDRLDQISDIATFLLPFEALYQGGLSALTSDTSGLTKVVVELGPFGGAEPLGFAGVAWALLYAVAAVALAIRGFNLTDL